METKQSDNKKGVWKRDPRGVDYVTFTMPEQLADSLTTFPFSAGPGGKQFKVQVTSSEDILGVIVLMRPKTQD